MPKFKRATPLRSYIIQSIPVGHQPTYQVMQKRMIQGLVSLRTLDDIVPRYTDIKNASLLTEQGHTILQEACEALIQARTRYADLMQQAGLSIDMLKTSKTYPWRLDISSPSARLLIRLMAELEATLSHLDLCWIADIIKNNEHISDEALQVQIVEDSVERLAQFVGQTMNALRPGRKAAAIRPTTATVTEDGEAEVVVISGDAIAELAEAAAGESETEGGADVAQKADLDAEQDASAKTKTKRRKATALKD